MVTWWGSLKVIAVVKYPYLVVLIFVSVFFVVVTKAYADTDHVTVFKETLEVSVSNKRALLVKNGEKVSKFRIKDLEELPLYEVFVPPIWENEDGKYQGVILSDILRASGMVDANRVKLVALDGYAIDLTLSKRPANCFFVATRYLMHEIKVDMKGPIRLLLPCMIGGNDKSYAEISTTNWIWNLKEIHMLD
ncbi:hypothetical protein [Kiloniella sp. EL199]|uniref:hypothetical protein n=1 Tax=Kiloniella sp. EL199 TaxID=2107581 RepID=UPI000EA014B5|nr:hypothetical protein [Kiloniella sp. EL199]